MTDVLNELPRPSSHEIDGDRASSPPKRKTTAMRITTKLCAAAFLLGTFACGDVADDSEGKITEREAEILAEYELPHDMRVVFVDEGDGHIGVTHIAPAYVPPFVATWLTKENATALEVFLATAPADLEVPQALQEDHISVAEQQGRKDLSPRSLASPDLDMIPRDDDGSCTSSWPIYWGTLSDSFTHTENNYYWTSSNKYTGHTDEGSQPHLFATCHLDTSPDDEVTMKVCTRYSPTLATCVPTWTPDQGHYQTHNNTSGYEQWAYVSNASNAKFYLAAAWMND